LHEVEKDKGRAKLSYALRRAYYEGYSKAILSKKYELQTEGSYTKTLLKGMLKNILKGRFSECFGILLVFVVVGFGWLFGKFR